MEQGGAHGDGPIIRVSAGSGTGRTLLSAFDDALAAAGVANYNLVRLSSVIPPGSTIVPVGAVDQLRGGFGDRLYCVYASCRVHEPGAEAWAGVGWSRRDDGSGAGLFVEHTGHSEAEVRHLLRTTLDDMNERRGGGFTYSGEVLAAARCASDPVCALVVATYRADGWPQP